MQSVGWWSAVYHHLRGRGPVPPPWSSPPCPVGASFRPRTYCVEPSRRGKENSTKTRPKKEKKRREKDLATHLADSYAYHRLKTFGDSEANSGLRHKQKPSCHSRVGGGRGRACPRLELEQAKCRLMRRRDATQNATPRSPGSWEHAVGGLLCAGYIPPNSGVYRARRWVGTYFAWLAAKTSTTTSTQQRAM